MGMSVRLLQRVAVFALTAGVLLAGCSVRVNKNDSGEDKDVSIHTPFGGMEVHNNGAAVDTGLPVYPGATLDPGKKGSDKSVDLHMGFGPWQVKVQVASYLTKDPDSKVQDFYKKALAQYGKVLTCHGNQPVGTPTQTADGLTCQDHDAHSHSSISTATSGADVELKAGSPQQQHVVAFEHKGEPGTHFALIRLGLPPNDAASNDAGDKDSGSRNSSEE